MLGISVYLTNDFNLILWMILLSLLNENYKKIYISSDGFFFIFW